MKITLGGLMEGLGFFCLVAAAFAFVLIFFQTDARVVSFIWATVNLVSAGIGCLVVSKVISLLTGIHDQLKRITGA